ncbi:MULTISPECIES: hypothetical protein [unclassified Nocardioides]|uniref:hypothetical protein n=1 Tax=unclassified Nocardioides TaxID=2615069 RepID=UPI0030154407
MPDRLSTLEVVVERSTPNYPTVRLHVDGVDVLDPGHEENGNDPADILDTGALVPQSEPRRIAFYGCGCGAFGCFVVAGLITENAGLVSWTDFRTVTGAYHSALPDPRDGPDPARSVNTMHEDPDDGLDLPDVHFDAAQYHAAVGAAMRDRNWESRARAVARLVRERLPDLSLRAAQHGDVIHLHHQYDGEKWPDQVALAVPSGSTVAVTDCLVALLEEGRDPREIVRRRLWH